MILTASAPSARPGGPIDDPPVVSVAGPSRPTLAMIGGVRRLPVERPRTVSGLPARVALMERSPILLASLALALLLSRAGERVAGRLDPRRPNRPLR